MECLTKHEGHEFEGAATETTHALCVRTPKIFATYAGGASHQTLQTTCTIEAKNGAK